MKKKYVLGESKCNGRTINKLNELSLEQKCERQVDHLLNYALFYILVNKLKQ